MLKIRLIPVLLLQNGLLVRSERFTLHQIIGNPVHEVRRFNEWNVDELIYLDITRDDNYDLRRTDAKVRGLEGRFDILDAVSRSCFMPLTWGGRIRTLDDMRACLRRGADKIVVNSQAILEPELISAGARAFGAQAVVVCIDAVRDPDGHLEVVSDGGRTRTGLTPPEWAREAETRGAGELLVQSVDRDGTGRGYDVELIESVSSVTSVPIIALGGVGQYDQYAAGVEAGASAVAAANVWHFKEMADRGGKRALARAGVSVRL